METIHTDLPNIMHEILEGEVVVVNLDNGTYYSFDGVGGRVWEILGAGGSTLAGLQDQLAAVYEGDPHQIADSIARFVSRLRDEGLVRVSAADVQPGNSSATMLGGAARLPFVEPHLQKYTDMEALLLADPIHEVDDAGWPHLK